ncbi:HAD-superfamily phosphatase, subfamily IIIC/FkbH-like domain-containing protein [Nitrosomonas aestuarii]|uniref:HAD-superfamily phosphatase, subfamily IIIC/FkbH-like domain-containing protein n=1 Tax=Nitrosomonas aestuarii TaxID=52441 RepID=A0A1I4CSP7_9PROT|nr:HAD-IIIC family phosphatase [Nitrosomonas aestuarii]SFK83813.1 HAD-superfamily phosphatase, subfamily IIIC/FkbH-like domain-containing protein [Nitrosomonas aestuarii]
MHDLPWLLKPADDFNERCAQLADSLSPVDEVLALANAALTVNQSNRLYRALQKLSAETRTVLSGTLTPFRLGIASNGTMDLMIPSMVTAAIRNGIDLEVITADFGQVAQEAFDPVSKLNQSHLDAVLLALDYRAYPIFAGEFSSSNEKSLSNEALGYLQQIRDSFTNYGGMICITQTLACPPYELSGNFDAQLDGTLRRALSEFNFALTEDVRTCADVMLDIAVLANMVGVNQWFDERQWYMSRVPMANTFIPLYTEYLTKLIAALRGKSKKCLVLDLDNTLWGGVIGDDGLEGIQVGQGHPVGEAFLAIQQWVKALKDLGIIITICSKNEKNIALEAFNKHSGMLLKEDDIAVFIANWNDKASNIRQIAEILNIGLDAMVFVDDNPAEREIIRTMIPEISVPELPKDPSQFLRILCAARYFEKIDFTDDDAQRSAQYKSNLRRHEMLQTTPNLTEYLASLEMRIRFVPFDEMGRKRIVQLINKTNQFNLTTRRYTEADVLEFEKSDHYVTLQVHLQDKFGDNGMVCVVICKAYDDYWEIDTWLMSCRVIKRRVEEAVCDEIVALARSYGINKLRGFYRPTEKNKLVKEHYHKLGFELMSSSDSEEVWELLTDRYHMKNPPLNIEKSSLIK